MIKELNILREIGYTDAEAIHILEMCEHFGITIKDILSAGYRFNLTFRCGWKTLSKESVSNMLNSDVLNEYTATKE
jgi:hypothetical protein